MFCSILFEDISDNLKNSPSFVGIWIEWASLAYITHCCRVERNEGVVQGQPQYYLK